MKASSNPWGVDESKYFQDVGGIQDFLSFQASLAPKLPEDYNVSGKLFINCLF